MTLKKILKPKNGVEFTVRLSRACKHDITAPERITMMFRPTQPSIPTQPVTEYQLLMRRERLVASVQKHMVCKWNWFHEKVSPYFTYSIKRLLTWEPYIFCRWTNSLEFTVWSSAQSSCWLRTI